MKTKNLLIRPSFIFTAIFTAFLGCIVIIIVLTQKEVRSAKAASREIYGISGHLVGLNSTDLNKSLDDYKTLGVQWVREDFEWPQIQPNNANSYEWSSHDPVVTAANVRGIKVLGILDYIPQWELPSGCTDQYRCPPKNNSDYATFASAVVSHYAPLGVHTWELWNEPNGGTFTPTTYTALIKAAYPAIKKADPNAVVLAGSIEPAATTGSTYSGVDFLTGIYQNGGKGFFDAVSDHPYCYGGETSSFSCPNDFADWSAWSQMQNTTPSLRSVMTANGDQNKQIWATEFGAPTGGGTHDYALPVTEAQQAQMVTDAYTLWSTYSWAGPLFWYTYQDPCTTTNSIECYFGLVRRDYSQKPAYQAYKNIAKQAISPTNSLTPMNTISPTLTAADSETLAPQQTGISLLLCPHGIGNCGDNANQTGPGNTSPKHQTRNITANLYNAANKLVVTQKGTALYNQQSLMFESVVYVSNIDSGTYLINIKMDGFLQKTIGIVVLTQGQITKLAQVNMTAGDINNDNQLDIQDYNVLISCYGSKQAAASCLTPVTNQTYGADINDDGVIDAIDYNLFLRELSVQRGQ